MRHGLAILALMLPLAGCVVPADGGYGGYSDYGGYPGYSYNSGSPTYMVGGIPQPLIYYGGSWGYYDLYRRFHRAPDGIHRQLEARHPGGGGGYRPNFGGGGYTRPVEAPRYGVSPSGNGPLAAFGGYRAPPAQYSAPRQTAPAFAGSRPAFVAPPQTMQRPVPSSSQSSGTHRRRDDDRR